MLADGNALIVTAGERNAAWPAASTSLALPDAEGRVDLAALMRELAARGINELHVEAGAKLTGALLDAGLVDELLLYLAPHADRRPGARHVRARRAACPRWLTRPGSSGTASSASAAICASSRALREAQVA